MLYSCCFDNIYRLNVAITSAVTPLPPSSCVCQGLSGLGTQPYVLGTQPYVLGTQPYVLGMQPYVLATQPYVLRTQSYVLRT